MSSLKKLREQYIEKASELLPGVYPLIPVINRGIYRKYGIVCKGRHTEELTTWRYERPDGTILGSIKTSTPNMQSRAKELYEFYLFILDKLKKEPIQLGKELDSNHYLVGKFLISKDLYLKSNKYDIVAQPDNRTIILKFDDNYAKVVTINSNGLFSGVKVCLQVVYTN